MKRQILFGMKDGIPIALGYLSVAFGFGIFAASLGITPIESWLISATNLTSAGQVAGVGIIAAAGSYLEMALAQLVINIRYSLMGLSLSQKLDDSFRTPQRLIVSYGITDEIFAMAYSKAGKLTPGYMYGLIITPFIGWTTGTILGAMAGGGLPAQLTDALGIMLYAMFLAVIIPAARQEKSILTVIAIAAIFYSTNNFPTAIAGTVVAAVLAYLRQPLIVVALAASAAALGVGFII